MRSRRGACAVTVGINQRALTLRSLEERRIMVSTEARRHTTVPADSMKSRLSPKQSAAAASNHGSGFCHTPERRCLDTAKHLFALHAEDFGN